MSIMKYAIFNEIYYTLCQTSINRNSYVETQYIGMYNRLHTAFGGDYGKSNTL